MPSRTSRTSRVAKEHIQQQKRRNRSGDLPNCPSLEDISLKSADDNSEVDPYAWTEHSDDDNQQPLSKTKVFGDVETAVSINSSSAPSVITTTKSESSKDTIIEVDVKQPSKSDSELTSNATSRRRRRHQHKLIRTAREKSSQQHHKSIDSLNDIRATFDQSIAKRDKDDLRQDDRSADIIKFGSSNGSAYSDMFPPVGAGFRSNVDGQDMYGMGKMADIGGDIASKLALFTLTLIRYFLHHPTPVTILMGLVAAYFIIFYLELSLAALVELGMQFFWPTTHILLRGAERFFKLFGNFLGQLDDLGQAVYCDLAHVWCRRFKMMCEDRCSFVEAVVDRMRT